MLRGLLAVAAAALLLPASAPAHTDALAANSTSFSDALEDSGIAPDITSVTIANDDKGVVTFSITLSNRPQGLDSVDYFQFRVDTDDTPTTGENGFEWLIEVGATSAKAYSWSGSRWRAANAPSLKSSYALGTLTVRFDFRALEIAGFVNFWIYADTAGERDGMYDAAPDAPDIYDYVVRMPLFLEQYTTPKTTKRGNKADAVMKFFIDSGAPATVRCTAKADKAKLKTGVEWTPALVYPPGGTGTTRPIGFVGSADCSFTVPKTTKAKKVTGTMTVSRARATVTRSFTITVR